MIEINTLGAYIGMTIVSIGVAILWLLADKNEGGKKITKKSKHFKHCHK